MDREGQLGQTNYADQFPEVSKELRDVAIGVLGFWRKLEWETVRRTVEGSAV